MTAISAAVRQAFEDRSVISVTCDFCRNRMFSPVELAAELRNCAQLAHSQYWNNRPWLAEALKHCRRAAAVRHRSGRRRTTSHPIDWNAISPAHWAKPDAGKKGSGADRRETFWCYQAWTALTEQDGNRFARKQEEPPGDE